MNLDWKLIRSIWVALLVPALIVVLFLLWPLGMKEWEKYQHDNRYQACKNKIADVFGRELNSDEEITELSIYCSHVASGGVFDHTYIPQYPAFWKQYFNIVGQDPCELHKALCQ